MAADQTAINVVSIVLVANTQATVNLIGGGLQGFELVHHGDDDAVVWYHVATEESKLATVAALADEISVLLPGERLTINRTGQRGAWVRFKSTGTPTLTVDGKI